jgi:non-lysosomal glucosylceramidase
MNNSIPTQAWKRRFDEVLTDYGKPVRLFSFSTVVKMLPVFIRIINKNRKDSTVGFDPISILKNESPGPNQGVPLGGMGGGSIGRGWRGDFRRWSMRPGFIHEKSVCADQFSLYVQRGGKVAEVVTLSPVKPVDGSLSAWNWGLDPASATYHALFPRSWTAYENPVPGIRLTCRQVSPFIPKNYRQSSYPAGVFIWTVENTGAEAAEVSLMFSFQNGTGTTNDLAGGHSNKAFSLPMADGVALNHIHRQPLTAPQKKGKAPEVIEDPLTFAIAARKAGGVKLSKRVCFIATGDGRDLWEDFAIDGMLEDGVDESVSTAGQAIGGAVSAKVKLAPGVKKDLVFSLAWDMPRIHTGMGRELLRRYTAFYGTSGDAAPLIARNALLNYTTWESQIAAWQDPILAEPKLPDWFKSALFNELYYLVEGGVFWFYFSDENPSANSMGHFGYLEGHEYRMVNTYDVHFYSSIALALLFPKIELSLQRDFAKTVAQAIPEKRRTMLDNALSPRKIRGAVPHDLGWPQEDPWMLVNGYDFHDSGIWKDLNPKFVLQVYRDYLFTLDRGFLKECWTSVEEAMEFMMRFDRDGDSLVENDGFPDQTYDTWSVSGPSAYTGCLWLASLQVTAEMAREIGKPRKADFYSRLLIKASAAYERRLWNGLYYNYDSSNSNYHNSIMADALAGEWYSRMCGLQGVVPEEHTLSVLKTIYEKNVMGIRNGAIGAMNGVHPDGSIDRTSMQSQEVWSGSTYALAATMIQHGMIEEGFKTAWGVYHMTYEKMGYWFQTPEAWKEDGSYRSIAYMRPLAIWGMLDAWEKFNAVKNDTTSPVRGMLLSKTRRRKAGE